MNNNINDPSEGDFSDVIPFRGMLQRRKGTIWDSFKNILKAF